MKSYDDPFNTLKRTSPRDRNELRAAVRISNKDLVRVYAAIPGKPLPMVIEAIASNIDAVMWARGALQTIEKLLLESGAILFRGFPLGSSEDFARFAAAVGGGTTPYIERSSPRTEVHNNIYTSTDYPSDRPILPHNEHSYGREFPQKLLFFCVQEPTSGGETPLGSMRNTSRGIDATVARRFKDKGWMYVRNFHPGLGLSWQTAFQTADRATVEAYCRKARIHVEWKKDGELRTRQIRPAFIEHPKTGEEIWFNHAMFFNLHSVPEDIRNSLLNDYGPTDLPHNTYYGDGTTIDASSIQNIRAAYEREIVQFQWQRGDVVLLDNILTSHARNPFTGPRKILCAMCDPLTRTDLHEI